MRISGYVVESHSRSAEEIVEATWLLITRLQDAGTAIVLLDAQGHVSFANRAFRERIGRAENEILGRPGRELFAPLEEPVRGRGAGSSQPLLGRRLHLMQLQPRGGPASKALCTVQPIDDAGGRAVGSLLFFSQSNPDSQDLAALIGALGADLRIAAHALRPDPRSPGAAVRGQARESAPEVPRELSAREREVLERLAGGRMPAAIARELHISPNTVRNHVRAIYRKLGVRSQLELLARFYEVP